MENLPNVFWSANAIRELENITQYLQSNWSDNELIKFTIKLNKAIALISNRPRLFRLTNKRNALRQCVLSKQTTIYYQEINSNIYIISLFDNRQDPAKKP